MTKQINIKLSKPASNIKITVVERERSQPVGMIKSLLYLIYVLFKVCLYLLIIPIYIYFGIIVLAIYIAILFTWVMIKAFMINFIISSARSQNKKGPV